MGNLVLDSFQIENFRAFSHLCIERLGRINLLTGKNNVGKTTVLEALNIYVKGGDINPLKEVLDARDEVQINTESDTLFRFGRMDTTINPANIKHLFHGRNIQEPAAPTILLGPCMKQHLQLSISLQHVPTEKYEKAEGIIRTLALIFDRDEFQSLREEFGDLLEVKIGEQHTAIPIQRLLRSSPYFIDMSSGNNLFVRATGLSSAQIAQLWDRVALTDTETDVLSVLRVITPEIERVNIVGDQDPMRTRIPVVKIKGNPERITLRSLGDGINRLFGFALALVNAKDGMLLIDEIENGLHYSILSDVWKLIFEAANRLNVQVFVATHSWDCIEAFQQASEADPNEEAMLIRLNGTGDTPPTLFDERKLKIATRSDIEVR
jgi:ABC-type cobalamin/Fe3+-siderophores transport system ATPase subunit